MMSNKIQKCIKIQKRENKEKFKKHIMKRKHEVYPMTFPK